MFCYFNAKTKMLQPILFLKKIQERASERERERERERESWVES